MTKEAWGPSPMSALFTSVEEPVDPSIYTGFIGTWSGGERAEIAVDVETVDFLRDLGIKGLAAPRPAPLDPEGAREADRIMESTSILRGAALPIAKETDERIVLSDLDRIVQSMVGWREHAPAAPGLPALAIPPRTEPEGWWEDSGVIQKKPRVLSPWETMPPLHPVFAEYISSYYERRRTNFADEFLNKPPQQEEERHEADGLARSGKIRARKNRTRKGRA